MGSGSTKRGTFSHEHARGRSKYTQNSPTYGRRNRSPQSASPPRRPLTQDELNERLAQYEEARVRAKWTVLFNNLARKAEAARAEKARLEAEAKRIANAIKRQKQQNNRLAAAAAANVNNVKNLNKTFKNNKTILGKLKRLTARLHG